ncbi:hypothetical protein STRNTR1_2226 [Stenotrophomonas maltophilia]|nr:hypothetical protein STRNTR1_2226 [Stenotrophomonas maltophilia]
MAARGQDPSLANRDRLHLALGPERMDRTAMENPIRRPCQVRRRRSGERRQRYGRPGQHRRPQSDHPAQKLATCLQECCGPWIAHNAHAPAPSLWSLQATPCNANTLRTALPFHGSCRANIPAPATRAHGRHEE